MEEEQYTTPNLFSSITGRKFSIKGRSFQCLDVLDQKKENVLVCKCSSGEDGMEYVVKIIKLDDEYRPSADPNSTYSDGYQVGEWRFADIVDKLFDSSVVTYEVSELIGNEIVLVSEYRGIDMQRYGKKKETLFLCEALEILIRTTNALHQLHKQNIIHSDVKPSNILITFNTTKYSFDIVDATLGDLGIARIISSETRPNNLPNGMYSTPDTTSTNTYTLHNGTAGYIAPECYEGKQCLSSDVWSLGRTMLWLLFARNQQRINRARDFLRKTDENSLIDQSKLLQKLDNYCQQVDLHEDSNIAELVTIGNLENDVRGWKQFLIILKGMLDESLESRFSIVQNDNMNDILHHIFRKKDLLGRMDISHQKAVLDSVFSENRYLKLLCVMNNVSYNSNLEETKDRDFVLEAVKKDGHVLKYADELFKKDREIVLEAVKQNGFALQYVESFKNDREIALLAVKQYRHGLALQYVGELLKADREIVLIAVKDSGFALEFADESFKKDREIVLEAVKQNGNALQYVDESLKADREILEASKRGILDYKSIVRRIKTDIRNDVQKLRLTSKSSKKDREIMLESVKMNDYALEQADESLKKDREFILQALKESRRVLKYADKSFRKERETVLIAVKHHGCALKYADELFKKDRDIILEAVKKDGKALKYTDESLRKDKEIVLEAIKEKGYALKYVDESFKKDREIVLEAVKKDGTALQFAESFKKDREIVLIAVKQNGFALRYVDELFKKDREIVLEAVKKDGYVLEYADESFKKDKEVVLEAVKKDGNALQYVDESLKKDKEIVLAAVKSYRGALEYADESIKKDKEFLVE